VQPRWVFLAEFAVVVIESIAFFGIGYVLCKRHRWARYAATILGSVCMAYRVLITTFPHRFYAPLPYLLVAGVITPAGFLLLAAAATAGRRTSRQRVLAAVFGAVLTYYVFCDVGYLAVRGPEIAGLVGHWQGATMRQSRRFTCGPAAGAVLLDTWGMRVREGELAFASRTSFRGTELSRLANAIRHFGRYKPLAVAIRRVTLDELHRMNRPAVLLVEKGRLHHVVTLLALDGDWLVIADPSHGTRRLTTAQFRRSYDWDGRALLAWRDPMFPHRSDEPPDPFLHH